MEPRILLDLPPNLPSFRWVSESPRNGDRAERRGIDQGRAAAHITAVQRAVATPDIGMKTAMRTMISSDEL